MIYNLLILSDENDLFLREIKVDSQSTFLDLNNFLLENLGYSKHEMSTFYVSDSEWSKGQEVMLVDMGFNSEDECYLMESTRLEDLVDSKGNRLLFIFDMLSERALFIEIMNIEFGTTLGQISLVSTRGEAPKQSSTAEEAALRGDGTQGLDSNASFDGLFDDDDQIDLDDLGEDWRYDDEFSTL